MSESRCVRALVLGDHVNTDLLHPPRFFGTAREAVLPGFLGGYPPEVAARFRPGDLIVGGVNFGCGSSREAYVRAFRYAGVGGVIAHSFSRIFYRNLINAGIPLATHPTLYQALTPWETVHWETDGWTLTRCAGGEVIALTPPDAHLRRILAAGGLLRYLGLEAEHAV
ncbi:MAG TPA: 3-isopropylmalate dehydratase [Armatimonadota bacterium]|nr:3-isopropylmalate dehydratase [Armatimonadota bacterium]HOS42821.1 3-isopropylmalate dehydratase [Armatimonadota bacterium]